MTSKNRIVALALAAFLLAVGLLAIPARLYIGDPYTWREEAINILLFHRISIPPVIALHHGEPYQYFTKNPRTGEWYSKYGIASGLLNVIPLGAELAVEKKLTPWDSPRRRLYLGVFYALLGAGFGAALFALGVRVGASAGATVLFILATVFATFAGFYLRATNSEAYQLLFFTLFLERVAAFRAGGFRRGRDAWLAWFWLLCLVHVKVSHVLVAAVFAGVMLVPREARRRALALNAAPLALLAASVGALNWWKFGSPFQSGYTLWARDDFSHGVPPWRIVWNLFLDPQWSIPLHFPLVVLAAFGARGFARRYPFESAVVGLSFLVDVAFVGSMPIWQGGWSYGPRYFLFLLPALSLPAHASFERFLDAAEMCKPRVAALLSGTVAALGVSAFLQFEAARLDPFFAYWVRPPVDEKQDATIARYFDHAPLGWIAAEAWWARQNVDELWWMKRLKADVSPDLYEQERKRLGEWVRKTNFYWWSPRD